MILTAKDIAEITRLLDESRFSQLKLEVGDFKLRISRGGAARPLRDSEPQARQEAVPPPPAPTAVVQSGGPAAGEADVKAPLLGNFYQAPRPGDPPFVKPGDRIEPDTVIGIIEVMKLMNSVRAGIAGTVVALLAKDGSAVEEGQPLIRVRTEG